MELSETIRVKYASGLYSNTELVLEYSPLVGAMKVLEILNYAVDKDVRPDLQGIIEDMPKVHTITSLYHRELRESHTQIEGTTETTAWKDREFAIDKRRLDFKLREELRAYPWVTPDVLSKLYHD